MNALDILQADEMKLNLTKTHLEVSLNGVVTKISLNRLKPTEAALLRLQYAKEVILPGTNTAAIFKQLDKEEIK